MHSKISYNKMSGALKYKLWVASGMVVGPGRQGPLWTAAWQGAGGTAALLAPEMFSETATCGCGLSPVAAPVHE